MKPGLRILVAVSILAIVGAPPAPDSAAAGAKPKVAFIYVGPIGDAGWTFQHDTARKYLEETLGVETAFVESVPETAEVMRVEEQFIQKGFKIIFATAFGYQNFNLEVAKRHPDVHTWNPVRMVLGAYLFGGVDALGFRAQLLGIEMSSILLRMLPYIFTLVVLFLITVGRRRTTMPAALGQPYLREG